MRQIFDVAVIWTAISVTGATQDDVAPVGTSLDRSGTRERIDATFNASLRKLLTRHSECTDRVRQFVQDLQIQRDPSRDYVVLNPVEIPEPSSNTDRQCLHSVARLRRQFAEQLAKLANEAAENQDFNDAFRLLHEASLHDPKHDLAKRVTRDRIHVPVDVKVKSGRTAYPEFGWRPGQYSYVNSSNYLVVSNANKEDVIELAKNLELLNLAWRQVFLEYWSTPTELSRIFSRSAPLRIPKYRFQVVLFATKQQYDNVIRRYERRAQITQGIYIPKKKTAYFHAEETESSRSTWKHEATHQLFAEAGRDRREASLIDNFWLLEGLATYMESLQIRPGYSMVGGLEADRLQFARYRGLCGIGKFSLEELTGWGRWELQRRPDISSIYSQAAGLAHFLIQTRRDDFMRYTKAVYSGRDSQGMLAATTGHSFEELEKLYHEYLMVDDADLRLLDSRATVHNLSLACTRVTDDGIRRVPLQNVRWLDLGLTTVTDEGLKKLDSAKHLKQLSLFHTAITDATVLRLKNANELEELDLSGTKVTDASLTTLLRLPSLKTVECEDTAMSSAGLQKLKAHFPSE